MKTASLHWTGVLLERPYLGVSLKTLVGMFVRYALLSGSFFLLVWCAVWLFKGSMPTAPNGASRLWDVFNGLWVGALVVSSFLLTRKNKLSSSAIIPDSDGRLYYRSDAILVFVAWAASIYGLERGVFAGAEMGLEVLTLSLLIYVMGLLALRWDIPGLVMFVVGTVEHSKLGRFLSTK